MLESPFLLFYHFFCVAFYAIYIMFQQNDGRSFFGKVAKALSVVSLTAPVRTRGRLTEILCIQFHTAVVVFVPLMWTEVRCWAPTALANVPNVLLFAIMLAGVAKMATWPTAGAAVETLSV